MPGEKVQLKKPLAVLTKVFPEDGAAHAEKDSTNPSCEYHTDGVIRDKLVFKIRPTPITRSLPQAPAKRARS